jgi:hypothetical protein
VGQNRFFSISYLQRLFRLLANTASVTFALGGSSDEASGVWSLELGSSAESCKGSSFASREFVAVSWSSTAFSIDSLELTSGVTALSESWRIAFLSGFFNGVSAYWWNGH